MSELLLRETERAGERRLLAARRIRCGVCPCCGVNAKKTDIFSQVQINPSKSYQACHGCCKTCEADPLHKYNYHIFGKSQSGMGYNCCYYTGALAFLGVIDKSHWIVDWEKELSRVEKLLNKKTLENYYHGLQENSEPLPQRDR